MSSRRPLIVGNWKLHGSLAQNRDLLNTLIESLRGLSAADVAVCLPYVYLFQAQQMLAHSSIAWGSQNVSQFDQGAYTSCISANMVAEFGCQYTIIGHSERRALRLESHQVAIKRLVHTLMAGMTPIYCVGETQEERDTGLDETIVKNQMLNVVYGLDDDAFALAVKENLVIAYEPVWAIGTGIHASPEQAQQMHRFIRQLIAKRDPVFAQHVRIIYGGSVHPNNIQGLLAMPDIDGALVGRCSLVAHEFASICHVANHMGLHAHAEMEPQQI